MQTFFLQIPISEGSLGNNEGAEEAPEAISKALELKGCHLIRNESIGEMQEKIYAEALAILKKKKFIFSLGGDHSITFPLAKAFFRHFGKKDSALIIFDAHADCYQFWEPSSHEDYVQVLVKKGFVEGENIMQIGLRKVWPNEEEYQQEAGIKTMQAQGIHEDIGLGIERISRFCKNKKNIYLSFDFDALDEKVAFATGYPEKNGLTLEEARKLIAAVLKSGKVKAADFAEYNPKLDKGKKGLKAAVEIAKAISGK